MVRVIKVPGLMKYIRFFLILYIFLSGLVATEASEILRLTTEDTRSLNQKGLPYLECAFTKLDISKDITSMPWARAQLVTEHGEYDGFFMASRNDKRDRYAVLSEPFFNIDWVYVVKKENDLTPDNPKFLQGVFAANRGSARNTWLQDKRDRGLIAQEIVTPPNTLQSLVMLAFGRVDVVLENNENLRSFFERTDYSASDFETYIARTIPVGIYFNKDFLKSHPDFLDKFNVSIKACKNSE
jgi:polar amino acid transport system substrate-binding protein